jgi:hypothetical protein
VTAAAIDCAATCSNGTFLEATPDPTSPVSDPCSGVQNSSGVYFCANLANTPPSCSTTLTIPNVKVGDTVVLQPGCYNNLDVSKAASVTFGCGLYIITGTLNARTSSSGTPKNISQDCGTGGPSGVTFYVSGSGSMDFGNNNINLSAPTSGDYAIYSAGEQNMLVYQTPGDTNTVNMQSATCSTCNSYMDGMIYAPSATLNYNQYSNTNSFGQVFIVAGTLNANGGMNSILTGPGGQPSYTVMVPVLGE